MRFLRKRINTYEEFADMNYISMFTESEGAGAVELLCQRNESVWLRNDSGKMTVIDLAAQAQIFPVFGSVAHDLDQDGNVEVLVTGNMFHTEVNTGRRDAGQGCILKYNTSSQQLTPLPIYKSGFSTPQDARSIAVLRTPKGSVVVVVIIVVRSKHLKFDQRGLLLLRGDPFALFR